MGANPSSSPAPAASPTGAAARLRQGLKAVQSRVHHVVDARVSGDACVSDDVFFGRRAPQAGSPAAPQRGLRGVVRSRAHLSSANPNGWYRAACKDAPVHIVVHCPRIARELLSADDGGMLAKPVFPDTPSSREALAHISDPKEWRRQRDALRDAIGGPASFAPRFGHLADRAAANLTRQLRSQMTPASDPERIDSTLCFIDLKPMVSAAAADAVSDIVAGEPIPGIRTEVGPALVEYLRLRSELSAVTAAERDAKHLRVSEAFRAVERTVELFAGNALSAKTESLLQRFIRSVPKKDPMGSKVVAGLVVTASAAAAADAAAAAAAARRESEEAAEGVRPSDYLMEDKEDRVDRPLRQRNVSRALTPQPKGCRDQNRRPSIGSRLKIGGLKAAASKAGGESAKTFPPSTPSEEVKGYRHVLDPQERPQPVLTWSEATSNASDCLIGGTETVTHLVLLTLLHLSHDNRVQEIVRKEVADAKESGGGCAAPDGRDGQAVPFEGSEGLRWGVLQAKCPTVTACLRETMRLYPPLLSLSRRVADPGGWTVRVPKPRDGHAERGDGTAHLRQGSRITVCTVNAARTGVVEPWRWNPLRPAADGGVTQGMPFGAGPRACPAGPLCIGIARLLVCRVIDAAVLFPALGQDPALGHDVPAELLPIYPWEASLRQTGSALRLHGTVVVGVAPKTQQRLSARPPPTNLPEAKQRTDDLHPAFEIAGAAPAPQGQKGFSPRWKDGGQGKEATGTARPGFGPMMAGEGGGVPRMLWVLSVPHKPEALGEYYFCPSERSAGLPIWVANGQRVIYSEVLNPAGPAAPAERAGTGKSDGSPRADTGSGLSGGSPGGKAATMTPPPCSLPPPKLPSKMSASKTSIPELDTSKGSQSEQTAPSITAGAERTEKSLRWLIGTRQSMEENAGWLVSTKPHGGTLMPHAMEWQRYDEQQGSWTQCPTTKVADQVPAGWVEVAQHAFETEEPEEEGEEDEDAQAGGRRTRSCPANPRAVALGIKGWQ